MNTGRGREEYDERAGLDGRGGGGSRRGRDLELDYTIHDYEE